MSQRQIPIEVLHGCNPSNPYLYISTHTAENFTLDPETNEGQFTFQGYWHIYEEEFPTVLEFLLFEGSQATHYKVEVQKKIQLEEVEQEGFEDADQDQHPTFGEDEECPGCRIILFPEYVIQIVFKVIEITPLAHKVEITGNTVSKVTTNDESDDLVANILRDIGTN
jgi:hypothetical protein